MQEQLLHNNDIWLLMARCMSGEATAAEEEQLLLLLADDAALQQQYELLKRMWHKNSGHTEEHVDEEEKENISRILQLAKTENAAGENIIPLRSYKKYWYAMAGIAAMMILTIGAWFYNNNSSNTLTADAHLQQLVAENGSRTRSILPDGSTVWLNAGSHISFNENFSGATREVTLDGEAYFDVVKQPQRPFIVHVSGYDIKVLGTAFNVKSYATDKTVETTLLRGLVQVTKQGDEKQKAIFLHPNEKLIADKIVDESASVTAINNTPEANTSNNKFVIKHLDTATVETARIETAWVYNRLEFRGEPFKIIASKLERWYNVKILFDDEKVQRLNFNGSFENETIEQALSALEAASAFNYNIDGKTIHIRSAAVIK